MTWTPNIAFALVLVILLGFLFLELRRRPKRTRPPSRTAAPPIPDYDRLAGLWIRERITEGLTAVHEELSRPLDPEHRTRMYRWLVRWAGLDRRPDLLRQGLEQHPWPDGDPEQAVWEIWRAYLEEGSAGETLLNRFVKLAQEKGSALGAPALKILLIWLMEARRYVQAWDLWRSLPDDTARRIRRRLHPVHDLLRRSIPQALADQNREALESMVAWLKQHAPHEALTYWTRFQAGVLAGASDPTKPLEQGIERTDHYWLYRTLESWSLEQGDPRRIEAVYTRRLYERQDSIHARVLFLLHDLRVERLTRARQRLRELQDEISFWPPYWQWLGYTAARGGDLETSRDAWLTYWSLVRRKARDIFPFHCEICGYGAPRWWDHCPACGRLGTLDLRIPSPKGPVVERRPPRTAVEMLENIFD